MCIKEFIDLGFNLSITYDYEEQKLQLLPSIHSKQSILFPLNLQGLIVCWFNEDKKKSVNGTFYSTASTDAVNIDLDMQKPKDSFQFRVFAMVPSIHWQLYPPFLDIDLDDLDDKTTYLKTATFFIQETTRYDMELLYKSYTISEKCLQDFAAPLNTDILTEENDSDK